MGGSPSMTDLCSKTLQTAKQNALDPCVWNLPGENGTVDGILGIHVDDLLAGGNERFEQKMRAGRKTEVWIHAGRLFSLPWQTFGPGSEDT